VVIDGSAIALNPNLSILNLTVTQPKDFYTGNSWAIQI
jgi:hypothetical protein